MDFSALDWIVNDFKKGILWFIVNVIFFTGELKDEAVRHVNSGVIRISGVCYGHNLIQGYRSIGQVFPERRRVVKLDYILGYVKIFLIAACIFLLIFLAGHIIYGR